MTKQFVVKGWSVVILSFSFLISFSQTNFTDKVADWKKAFPKEDVIAASCKEVVDFSLNPNPRAGESRVRASVYNEVVIVPVKDYLKYDDGLFYNDEVSIDNFKVVNAEGKEVKVEKTCGDYQDED